MKFAIDANFLGTSQHLIVDEDKTSWSAQMPNDCYQVGSLDPFSVEEMAHAICLDYDPNPDTRWQEPWRELGLQHTAGTIPWTLSMPDWAVKEWLQKLRRDTQNVLCNENCANYHTTFSNTQKLLRTLRNPSVDKLTWEKKTKHNKQHIDVLKNFEPTDNGEIDKTIYSRKSSTGRLKVSQGPNPLILAKEHRDIFRSRYSDGKIIQIDYVSLEPRVLLALCGKEVPEDVHTHVASAILGGLIDRNTAKVVIMGVMYGIGEHHMTELIGAKVGIRQIMNTLKDYFGVNDLGPRLKRQHDSMQGYIKNGYGRILKMSRNDESYLISHYVQSTAADAALLGFSKMVEHIQAENLHMSPCFVIHDSLVLDVSAQHASKLKELCLQGQKVDLLSTNLFTKIKKF